MFQAPFRTNPVIRAKRGGGGAPLRSSTGQIITKFREDPIISFSDSARKHVENHLRYKTSSEDKKQYKMELDRCRAERMRRDVNNAYDMVRSSCNNIVVIAYEILIVCSMKFGGDLVMAARHGVIHDKLVNPL